MFRLRPVLAFAFVAALFTIPSRPAHAIDVTPYAGVMMPAKALGFSDNSFFRMSNHTVYGLGLGTSVGEKLGLELVLGAGSGEFELVGTTSESFGSTLLLADLRGRLDVVGGEDAALGVVAGVGYTDFKTGVFDFYEETDAGAQFDGKLTGILGLDVRAALSDRLHLTVSAIDRLHEQGIVAEGLDLAEKTQHDLLFSAGLRFPLR